jgi:hypothetical protein
MRISAFYRYLTLLLILSSPLLLRAQFQEPTPEELKMTSDPKAPGAVAVYLNVEEISDDQKHFQSFYARIKVLTEKGKELATVEIPYLNDYMQVQEIQARTIHADGTVIPLKGKPADLLVAKETTKEGEFKVNQKVFNLPSVEVGSILEYRYVLNFVDADGFIITPPDWKIQKPDFVHKAHYAFTPLKEFQHGYMGTPNERFVDRRGRPLNTILWWKHLPPGEEMKQDGFGRFSLNLTDIPPCPQEEWMPPTHSFLYRVLFYYKYASNSQDFWVDETKLWSKDVDHFADSSKVIHEAVNGLIASADSDLEKAKKLYKAVQALDNTDFSRTKSAAERKQLKLKEVKHAEDTWAQKNGDSEDIALLYIAMLRAAGLTAYDMKLVNRENGVFDYGYLRWDQLTDDVVILSSGGQEYLLDPGEKMCPFLTLHWEHAGASGSRQSPDGHYAATTPLPDYKPNSLLRTGDITLDERGAITGNFRFIMTGQEALRWRQKALENDTEEVKKQFDEWLEKMVPDGVEAHIDHFLSLDNPDANLMAMVNVHGTLGAATSKRLLLPAFFFETRGAHPFVEQEKRQTSVDMHYADQVKDQITYHFPTGFSVEGAPQDASIPWAGHAVLVTKSASAPGEITIARSLVRAFTVAKPEEYQDLRGFYQKIAAADQQQLVLTTAPAAPKGN